MTRCYPQNRKYTGVVNIYYSIAMLSQGDHAAAIVNVYRKFGEGGPRGFRGMQADRHTDRHTDMFITIYFAPIPCDTRNVRGWC